MATNSASAADGVPDVRGDPRRGVASATLGFFVGFANAAVFGLVPNYVPEAVGVASGLVGGLGAFGGFAIPPVLGLFVDLEGTAGYVVFLGLAVLSAGLSSGLYRTRVAPSPDGPVPADD